MRAADRALLGKKTGATPLLAWGHVNPHCFVPSRHGYAPGRWTCCPRCRLRLTPVPGRLILADQRYFAAGVTNVGSGPTCRIQPNSDGQGPIGRFSGRTFSDGSAGSDTLEAVVQSDRSLRTKGDHPQQGRTMLRLCKPLQRLQPIFMRRNQFTADSAANKPQKQARLRLFCDDPAAGRRGFNVPSMRAARSCRALRRPDKHSTSLKRDNLGFEVGAQCFEAEPRSGFQLGTTLEYRDVRTLLIPARPRCAVDQMRPNPLRGSSHIDVVMRENDGGRRRMVRRPRNIRIRGL